MEIALGLQSLVPAPSLMTCAAAEWKQRNLDFNDINELMYKCLTDNESNLPLLPVSK